MQGMHKFVTWGLEIREALRTEDKEKILEAWEKNSSRMRNIAVGGSYLMQELYDIAIQVWEKTK